MSRTISYLPPAVLDLHGLALEALPNDKTLSLDTSRHYCHQLATQHYENFSVVSWLLPKALQQHFYNVYAYCRWADDLADETGDPTLSLELLAWWGEELQACFQGRASHPVFLALEDTIRTFDIPMGPFQNLLTAFRQDQHVTRYTTYEDLSDYCRNSANPVGHLVLYLCGYSDAERQRLSDATCTALQLANFWQDVSVDLQKGRIYIPLDDMAQFDYTETDLLAGTFDDRFVRLMAFEVVRARKLFDTGLQLCEMLDSRVRTDIELFNRGGLAILDLIERQNYDVLTHRPSLSKMQKISLMIRYAYKRFRG